MDLSTATFLGIIAVLSLNQALLRVPALRRRQAVDRGVQTVNVVAGAAVVWVMWARLALQML